MRRWLAFLSRSFRTFFQTVRELLRSSRWYRRATAASAILLLLVFALPAWRILPSASQKPFIPLHYNVYMGVDAFGPWYDLFLLPALGLALLVTNVVFQTVFYRRERVLSVFFAVATIATECILLVAMVLIVLLNI